MKNSYNPLLNDPEIKYFLDTYPISSTIHDQFLLLGSNDQRSKIYRPDLRNITGSIIGSLIYSQLLYYLTNKATKEKKSIFDVEIYKFKEPCNHSKYKELDSWCEELNISRDEFDIAIRKIGVKVTKKNPNPEKIQTALIIYRTDINRITWYSLNKNYFSNLLKTTQKEQKNNSRNAGKPLYEKQDSRFSLYKEDITKKTYSFSSSEEKGNNKRKLVAKQLQDPQGSKDSIFEDKSEPDGSLEPSVPRSSKKLNGTNGKNGKNNSCCKRLKVRIKPKKKKQEITLPKIPSLKKIHIEHNPLHDFNFPQEVFEILNHWKKLGGQYPKDPTRRKTADELSFQIQELLIKGNNPYTSVLKDSEIEQFRDKKWTVKEIKDTITYFVKDLCKPIDNMPFYNFIVHRNFKANRTKKDFSWLVEIFQLLPQELSYIAKKLKNDFVTSFPEVHFYDKAFINIASFLEKQLEQYQSELPYGNIYFNIREVNELFFIYMQKQTVKRGNYEDLKYMSNPQNLKEFIKWCKKSNLIVLINDRKRHKKEMKIGYKNQLKSYQLDIERGKSVNWDEEQWDYLNYIKEQVEETC